MEPKWKTQFRREIEQAETARAAGNEGKARVCARRAAGVVAAEYLNRKGEMIMGPSAYDHLRSLRLLPGLPVDVQETLDHFTIRVTPEYQLPVQADLIAEAGWLAETLLGER